MAVEFTIPETITVHLGAPDDDTVGNVTVPFLQYIKNVASSEIYPTWPENAIRANMYAQISFALNRIFTEYYRSRGYNFDITNTTQYDQAFVYERDIFENISQIADELFNDYIVRPNDITPLFARYCNGTTSTCPGGLSQWGTVALANQGYSPYDILRNYYGNISLVEDAPIADLGESYPGFSLRIGSTGDAVKRIQISLNRISRNYPAIPKISVPDGIFDLETENAVKEFQKIFNLDQDGIVGKSTWYKIAYVFSGVKRLNELNSEGISPSVVNSQFKGVLEPGDTGNEVRVLQYYLNFISEFNDFIPAIEADGIYGPATENSVRAFQQSAGLPQTGIVDEATWNAIYSSYKSKYDSLPLEYRTSAGAPYPGDILRFGSSGTAVRTLQTYLNRIAEAYPSIPKTEVNGFFGQQTQDAVLAYARQFGFPPRGFVNLILWNSISELYSDLVQGGE